MGASKHCMPSQHTWLSDSTNGCSCFCPMNSRNTFSSFSNTRAAFIRQETPDIQSNSILTVPKEKHDLPQTGYDDKYFLNNMLVC